METKKRKERAPTSEVTDANLADSMWRLNNLYWIQDKAGKTVLFVPNVAQKKLYDDLHSRNLIVKARQLGFSTGIDIFMLDCALFMPGFHAGIVADTEDTAQDLFRTKVQFPYEHLPPSLQSAVNIVTANKSMYEFTNGSAVEAGVTLRSGTFQSVHVSEFAKISVEHPERADEIVSGSLETVPTDGIAFIESTARGRGGRFYDYYKQAAKNNIKNLTDLDYRLHFFAWFNSPEYEIDPSGVVMPERLTEYFNTLSVPLSPGQKAWYCKKEQALGEDMKREYPSTCEEAFEQSLEGAYFTRQLAQARNEGRICVVPLDSHLPVDTHWDLGMDDYMAIIFTQKHAGKIRVVDFFECNGEGLPFYAKVLQTKGYKYGQHNAPHDIQVKELSGKTRLEQAAALGIRFTVVPRIQDKADAIEMARSLFKHCVFDATHCSTLLTHLEEYRKAWDSVNGVWKSDPAKTDHNHAADAFMTLAQGEDIPKENIILTSGTSNWKTKWKTKKG